MLSGPDRGSNPVPLIETFWSRRMTDPEPASIGLQNRGPTKIIRLKHMRLHLLGKGLIC